MSKISCLMPPSKTQNRSYHCSRVKQFHKKIQCREKEKRLKSACTLFIWSLGLRRNSDEALALFYHSHSSTLWNAVIFSAQKHQIIPGAGLLAKGNITRWHAELTECWALSFLTSTVKAGNATEEDTLRKAEKAKGRKKKYNVLLLFLKETCWATKRSLEVCQKPIPPCKWQKLGQDRL